MAPRASSAATCSGTLQSTPKPTKRLQRATRAVTASPSRRRPASAASAQASASSASGRAAINAASDKFSGTRRRPKFEGHGSASDPRITRVECDPSRPKICLWQARVSIRFAGDPRQIHRYPSRAGVRVPSPSVVSRQHLSLRPRSAAKDRSEWLARTSSERCVRQLLAFGDTLLRLDVLIEWVLLLGRFQGHLYVTVISRLVHLGPNV